ncbi:threonine/serine exporter family protein [Clostridium aminobutyricum]|uniref:Threonine/serine exporter family protein n=1 Tax=Clostridium aminobutyricum TaxID=33953 RepID=A0A939D8G3_CLOAM|nr:threonine/serine exporter family protein [Clostridium aminobutyricum]MBN7773040.1 threonine/serine exporter family protein [Clostridium aminobutyricum]
MNIFLQFIFGLLATIGFCILFHVPTKKIIGAGFVGAAGWATYMYSIQDGQSKLLACFFGACIVGLFADILSRVCKEAAIIYIIPGIIPLVPGAGMYYTTLYLINGDLSASAAKGTETLLMAGSISVGLLVVGSILRIRHVVSSKFQKRITKKNTMRGTE